MFALYGFSLFPQKLSLWVARAPPRTPLGELTALPRPLAAFRGKGPGRRERGDRGRGKGKGKRGEKSERGGEGKGR